MHSMHFAKSLHGFFAYLTLFLKSPHNFEISCASERDRTRILTIPDFQAPDVVTLASHTDSNKILSLHDFHHRAEKFFFTSSSLRRLRVSTCFDTFRHVSRPRPVNDPQSSKQILEVKKSTASRFAQKKLCFWAI